MSDNTRRICSRCVYGDTIPRIEFDDDGVCNYCHMHDELLVRYPAGMEGRRHLQSMADEIKKSAGGEKDHDAGDSVIGGESHKTK